MHNTERTKEEWLQLWGVTNYKETPNGIDVEGDVVVRGIKGSLPIKFNSVNGNFQARFCFLANWNNFPKVVSGNMDVSHNSFKNFEGYSTQVGGNFIIHSNRNLNIFTGIQKIINGDLDVSNCNFSILTGCPEKICGNLFASKNLFASLNTSHTIEVIGDADFSSNKIITEDVKIKVTGSLDLSDNPINPDDDLKENATWS